MERDGTAPRMDSPHDLTAELTRHAAGLRHIARDLLHCGHAAEDAVQDTMRAALAQPDLQPGPLGGWLHRTMTNFVHQWRRRERRRRQREERLPPPEPVPSPPDALGHRETLLLVTQAVLSLDEPYQTAIFQRYFEDLPPRAIARRAGCSVATVKSRLQRGLVLLRARLDRSRTRSDWRAGLALCLGLPLATTAAAGLTTTGLLLMSTTTKVTAAAGLTLAGGLLFLSFGAEPAPASTDLGAPAGVGPDAGFASATTATTAGIPQREAADPIAAAPADWLDHPYEMQVEFLVVDALGLPVEGNRPRLSLRGSTLNDAPKATGPDGRTTVAWRSRRPEGELVVVDGQTRRLVSVQHGVPTRVVLLANGGGGPTLALSGVRLERTRSIRFVESVTALDQKFRSASRTSNRDDHLHPFAHFTTTTVKYEPPREPVQELATQVLFDSGFESGISFEGGVLRIAGAKFGERLVVSQTGSLEAAAPANHARIAGTVFGEDGKPVAEAPVVLLGSSPQPLQRTETGDDGTFVFENVLAGDFTVRAGGDAAGLATTPAVTTTGTTPVTLNLQRGATVRGVARGADGKALAKARVTWRASDGTWCDATATGDDGTFVLANLPTARGTVQLWASDDQHPLPMATAADVLCDAGDIALQVPAGGSALLADPVAPEGLDGNVTARAFQLDLGIGANLVAGKDGEPRRLLDLSAGWYRVEYHHPAVGWIDGGRHWLDGSATVDLGRPALPRPTKATFVFADGVLPAEGRAIEVSRLRADADVRIETDVPGPDGALWLPAGDYVLAWRDRHQVVHFDRFSTKGGDELAVHAGP
jgi:RNA polymerase sigma factor (sigma-70 family)